MTVAVLRTEWLTALRRRRLFVFNILIPLTLVTTIALSPAPAVHAAAVFTVLFALFGTFGSSIPLIRDGESGLLRRYVLTGIHPGGLLLQRVFAAATLDLVELAPEWGREQVLDAAMRLRWDLPSDFHDVVTQRAYEAAEEVAARVQMGGLKKAGFAFDRKLDSWLTSRIFGFPLMLLILALVFWITSEGANVPSSMLATLLVENGRPLLHGLASAVSMPWWLDGFLIDGV